MYSETEPDVSRAPGSNAGRRPVLCIGNDDALLSYRGKVLTQAGFQVVTARPQPEQKEQFAGLCCLYAPALVIVCHTLSPEQRIRVATELRETCPGVMLLALTNGALTPKEAGAYDLHLDSLDGPAALIRQVRNHV